MTDKKEKASVPGCNQCRKRGTPRVYDVQCPNGSTMRMECGECVMKELVPMPRVREHCW